jgi:NADPH:quinone reductase-like Zn-dependent oxidoreductase
MQAQLVSCIDICGRNTPPSPAADEVLIKVYATGVNPADWKIWKGLMKDRLP